ncbi:elongation factor-like protein [Cryptosporidium ryanae]|uniref:elongation factor-like protein n=1 Tax=Cryptosporidium ryanae TaxID=515981 RepID=UPI00351A3154|nr:elongation factor-like protein [Cryptosporidium ryanae]
MSEKIRNVCIIAHVDHGKTTMADYLLASNNILSNKSAGTMRFLDSREDEQCRFITMKSSSVRLNWRYEQELDISYKNGDYMINLIDSPGHFDFTYEVMSSLRISDGALLLIDVVEGIGDQTKKLLQHAYKERLKIILVINKMDRLMLELRYDVKEAYSHINKLIEQLNVILHQLIQEEIHEMMLVEDQGTNNNAGCSLNDIGEHYMSDNETLLEFSFENGNILFTSCLHGWCIDIAGNNLLKSISNKLVLPWNTDTLKKLKNSLCNTSYYYNAKTKKISNIGTKKDQPNIFVQFVLDPVWNIYNSVFLDFNREKIIKILKVLDIYSSDIENIVSEYEKILSSSDNKVKNTSNYNYLNIICKYIMSNWLPLSKGVFDRVIDYIPNPTDSNKIRFPSIYTNLFTNHENYVDIEDLKIVFVSKFSTCDLTNKRLTKDHLKGNEKLNGFVGISRIFHGSLSVNDELYVSANSSEIKRVKVLSLYNLLGGDLIPIEAVESGNVFALCLKEIDVNSGNDVEYADDEILGKLSCSDRTLTLSNHKNFPSFNPLYKLNSNSSLSSIIKVSVQPKKIQDLPLMLRGFELLTRSDPCVEISTLDTGEYILGCQGEVHLERCIFDLQNVFAQIPLVVSKPLISVREGLVNSVNPSQIDINVCKHIPFPPWSGNNSNLKDSTESKSGGNELVQNNNRGSVPCELATIQICAEPMNEDMIVYLEENQNSISNHILNSKLNKEGNSYSTSKIMEVDKYLISRLRFLSKNDNKFVLIGVCVKKGSITLLQSRDKVLISLNWSLRLTYDFEFYPKDLSVSKEVIDLYRKIINGIILGYEIASTSGPLCEEPIRGVVFTLVEMKLSGITDASDFMVGSDVNDNNIKLIMDSDALISNQLTTLCKELCRKSMLQRGNVRIYEIYLNMAIFCEQSVLGKVYSVINKRRGSVYNEELKEGTSTFKIQAYIPIIESLGINQELRGKASGNISFYLSFSHWELLDEDPFPESNMTMEEFEDDGLSKIMLQYNIDNANISKDLTGSIGNGFYNINSNNSKAGGIYSIGNGSNINNSNSGNSNSYLGCNAGNSGLNSSSTSNINYNNTNIPRYIINSIRNRKGLPTQNKIVTSAEKQRTLNKKK